MRVESEELKVSFKLNLRKIGIYMKLVKSLSEIKDNMKVIDDYLSGKDEYEKEYAKERIKS